VTTQPKAAYIPKLFASISSSFRQGHIVTKDLLTLETRG